MNNYSFRTMSSVKPREKMLQMGAASLSDAELLAIILQTGVKGKDVFKLASELDRVIKKTDGSLEYQFLKEIPGMGEVKALKILACMEYSKRYKLNQHKRITAAGDVFRLVYDITEKNQEHFVLLTLNGASCLLKKRTLFIGTINKSIIHPREIFAYALQDRAANIIFVHNHPSGNISPSEEDIMITRKLKSIGEMMDINVLDHVIVSKDDYYSFSSNNIL